MSDTTHIETTLTPPRGAWRFNAAKGQVRLSEQLSARRAACRQLNNITPDTPERVKSMLRVWGIEPMRHPDGSINLDPDTGLAYLADFEQARTWANIARFEWHPANKVVNALKPFIRAARDAGTDIIEPDYKFAKTGRLVISRYPVHSLPKTERHLLTPVHGNTVVAGDWSSLELRIVAAFSEDETLRQWYHDGLDPFALLGTELNTDRVVIKRVIYGLIYGAGERTTASQIGVSINGAKQLRHDILTRLHGVATWRDNTIRQAKVDRHVISAAGRRIDLTDPLKPDTDLSYRAPNYLVQASGVDLLTRAVSLLTEQRSAPPELTWHDAIYLTTNNPERAKRALEETMTDTPDWMNGINLAADITTGRNLACT